MDAVPEPVARLIEALDKLPNIGPKQAQRLTYYLLRMPPEEARSLAQAITEVKEKVHYCSRCFNISTTDPCSICANPQRDQSSICVVEEPLDILALERTHLYKGLYHVLHGAISPMNGIGVDDLRIRELLKRLESGEVREVILATNPNLDGDATAGYLSRNIPNGIKVTRLGRGLPIGGDLEYADDITLSRALEDRREM